MCSQWDQYNQIHCDYPMDQWTLSSIYDQHLATVDVPPFSYVEEEAKQFYSADPINPTNIISARPNSLPRVNSFESYISQQSQLSTGSQYSLFSETTKQTTVAAPQQTPSTTTSALSPSPSDTAHRASPPPKRRRGRPRLRSPDGEDVVDSVDGKPRRTRLPHNQVERKYRQGLNAELERLRKTIPTLPQRSATDLNAPPRPSKATVLASAITYIQAIEAERDKLQSEVETLRAMHRGESRNSRGRWYGSTEGKTTSPER